MVIMESYYSQDQVQELWRKIDQLHMKYLEMDQSSEKIIQRTKLEGCIADFLCVVPHKQKFVLPETDVVLYTSAAYKKDFSGYRAATGWNALQMYAGNLWMQPWRKEYWQIKTYCGFYKHQIEANLIGAEKIFEIMGYKSIGIGVLALDGPVCPDRVIAISRDCLVAYVECQILKHMWEEISTVFNITWLEILEYRKHYSGSPDQCIKNIKYKYLPKQPPDQVRNTRNDFYENKYQPTSPTSQISVPVSHNYMPTPSHNHVALPVPTVPFCMPLTNSFSTYGYAPCNAHMPVVNQPLPAIAAANGFYYASGYPMISPGYPVPTGQLIEIESRNGYDTMDASLPSRARRTRTDSNGTRENDIRIDDPNSDLAIRDDDKQDIEDDWGYVYRNLEKQGYSKDLGERGDLLGLTVSDKQRKHSRESKKVKSTNLDEVLNSLTVADRPLKMTEALERMEQRSAEKIIVQPKERRQSQGSSYENISSEVVKTVKPTPPVPLGLTSVKPSGTQTKGPPKEKTEKHMSISTTNIDVKKLKDKEKSSPSKWECGSCTYINEHPNDICEICSKSRNIGREQPIEVGGAECSKCTLVNPRSAKNCQACSNSLKDSPTYI